MKKFFTKRVIYIILFAILYAVVAFSSFYHAVAFFGLANNLWMSVILAFAFEIGQAAVLLSLLTSSQDRKRIMPWVLMSMFTLVQVIGNVFSSYKYLVSNSSEDLRFFKEPIFIWTDIPDNEANVIITYIVGAILPITALLLTGMITNYLNDTSEENIIKQPLKESEPVQEEHDNIVKEKSDEVIEPVEETKPVEVVEQIEETKPVEEKSSIDDIISKLDTTVKQDDLEPIENISSIVDEPVKEPLIEHKEVINNIPAETQKEIKSRFLN